MTIRNTNARNQKLPVPHHVLSVLGTTRTPGNLVLVKGHPLSPLAPRINADVARWASGATGCSA